LSFADYCTYQPVLPIEESPLHKAVLAAVVTASASVAAVAGPIVIVYFAGAILVGGASTVVVKVADRWTDKRFPP
jgi:hypothetical protein